MTVFLSLLLWLRRGIVKLTISTLKHCILYLLFIVRRLVEFSAHDWSVNVVQTLRHIRSSHNGRKSSSGNVHLGCALSSAVRHRTITVPDFQD